MKSFVDLLFILLCGTIVMLSRSVEVGAVQIDPAKVGSGGVSQVKADDVIVVSVNEHGVSMPSKNGEEIKFESIDNAATQVPSDKCVLLSAATDQVTHHRIMHAWSGLVKAGKQVKLAATETPNDGLKPIDRKEN